jgi:hypothetical protein
VGFKEKRALYVASSAAMSCATPRSPARPRPVRPTGTTKKRIGGSVCHRPHISSSSWFREEEEAGCWPRTSQDLVWCRRSVNANSCTTLCRNESLPSSATRVVAPPPGPYVLLCRCRARTVSSTTRISRRVSAVTHRSASPGPVPAHQETFLIRPNNGLLRREPVGSVELPAAPRRGSQRG